VIGMNMGQQYIINGFSRIPCCGKVFQQMPALTTE
jgi:hypothetical protein